MGTLSLSGLTGEGQQHITDGSFVHVTDIAIVVTDIGNPRVREFGLISPHAIRFAGVVWLGGMPEDDVTAALGWVHQSFDVRWNVSDTNIIDANFYAPAVGWRLRAGVTVDINVNY